jgi:hypothetical protein
LSKGVVYRRFGILDAFRRVSHVEGVKIAILGCGALLWDPSELKLSAPFKLIRPSLPIEFCHISKNLRFALIIAEVFGTLCRTYATTSAFTDLKGAIENLRLRGGCIAALMLVMPYWTRRS